MRKVPLGIFLIILVACQKQVDYMPQINALNDRVSSLQKSRDSLAAALAQTNNNLNATNNNIAENTLFSTSYFYKVSKKINLNASLLNIFDTPFFTTTNSMSNFVNSNQFSLRTRQFTLGFTYSL
jgi:outer membrane receptor for ferrienterochelin and colicin